MTLRTLLVSCVLGMVWLLPVQLQGADYFVSASGGSDDNDGLSAERSWKSLEKIGRASLKPGDTVGLKRGDSWEEQLNIRVSGDASAPIVIGAYGSGPKPRIKTSNTFSDWELVIDQPEIKIWQGRMKGIRTSFIAVQDDARLPSYLGSKADSPYRAPDRLEDMEDGFYYAPLNKGRFFVRRDSGNPGEMEIGARPFGITIRSQAYVTIRDIAIFGGRGRSEKGSATNTVHILVDDSSHIQLLNISSYHHGGAIRIANGSRNNLISALDAYGHQSTAVYFWKAGPGNIIEASDISRSGNVITDKGDMGLVGVFQSPQTTVRNCRLSDNGHHGALRTDGAISYVQSPGGQIVGNTITNAGGTGIKVAVGSDECLISHNRIDGWCTRGSSISTQKSCDGIRIGGGPRHEQRSDRNCKISNNQIISSIDHGEERAALKIMDMPTEGLIFENNEVIVMPGTVLVHAEASPRADEWTFRDNTYRVESHQHVIYRLGQTTFRAWEILGGNLGRIYSNYGLEQGSSVVIISDR